MERVDDDELEPDILGRPGKALERVEEEETAHAVALVSTVDCEASDQYRRDRVPALPTERGARLVGFEAVSHRRRVARDLHLLLVEQEERARGVTLFVLSCVVLEPVIEHELAAVEVAVLDHELVERAKDEHGSPACYRIGESWPYVVWVQVLSERAVQAR